MKKLLIVAGMVLLSTGTFAKEKTTKKATKENKSETVVESQCCTATLTYNGAYVDSRTVCGMITTGDNCNVAAQQLRAAYKFLSAE